jgi:adenosylmethionine-8-amino-7-oxononanoate aminotransferase
MGNALACAAAHGSLDLFERDDFAARVARLEALLQSRLGLLRTRADVVDVRVRGAIGVVEMKPGKAPASAALAERGVFLRPLRLPHADVLYVMPPLVIDEPDANRLLDAIDHALAA